MRTRIHRPIPHCSRPDQKTSWVAKVPAGASCMAVAETAGGGKALLGKLYRRSPEIAQCASLAREFCRLIRQRDVSAWLSWRDAAIASPLVNFAKHLRHDQAAILATLQQHWSNGPVEGHVHRLKLISAPCTAAQASTCYASASSWLHKIQTSAMTQDPPLPLHQKRGRTGLTPPLTPRGSQKQSGQTMAARLHVLVWISICLQLV